jgi:hypothetical protein
MAGVRLSQSAAVACCQHVRDRGLHARVNADAPVFRELWDKRSPEKGGRDGRGHADGDDNDVSSKLQEKHKSQFGRAKSAAKVLVGVKYMFAVGQTEGNVEGGVRGDRAQVQHLTVQNHATFAVVAAAPAADGTVRRRGCSICGKRLQPQRPNRSFERLLTGHPTAAAALATVAAAVSPSFTPLHRLKYIAATATAERSLHASRHVRPRRARPVRKAGRRGGVAGAVQEDAVVELLCQCTASEWRVQIEPRSDVVQVVLTNDVIFHNLEKSTPREDADARGGTTTSSNAQRRGRA